MILEALIAQLRQRFEFERRAQVCLWFDEKREFLRLLPALHARLTQDRAFRLLEYDAEACHGQIWIKHQIHRALAAAASEARTLLRFVVYLPLSEDRLESADQEGRHHLELLAEYQVTGLIWRVGGKRPTLFSFLRQAGVCLPESPAEQRRLWEGGENSLLAKYAAAHAERPEAFRDVVLTPELVQSRLIGDVEQTVLELAAAPETKWEELRRSGLAEELVNAVGERYGFHAPIADPAQWVRGFVTTLALTEAFLAYGEPSDFPFADRLPPAPLRQQHVQFLSAGCATRSIGRSGISGSARSRRRSTCRRGRRGARASRSASRTW